MRARRGGLPRFLLVLPEPFDETVHTRGQMSPIGAERDAESLCHGLLFQRPIEIG